MTLYNCCIVERQRTMDRPIMHHNNEIAGFEKMEVQVEQTLSYVNQPDEILAELRNSKQNGNVIGIFALSLGPIMIMAAVDEVVEIKNDYLIILKETDLLGIRIPEEQIFLSEIVRVHPFKTRYDDPFHVRLRETTSGQLRE
jgi:hypothetical protein